MMVIELIFGGQNDVANRRGKLATDGGGKINEARDEEAHVRGCLYGKADNPNNSGRFVHY